MAITGLYEEPMGLLQIISLAVWVPIEAVLLAWLGTTPGKALCGIRVLDEHGNRLSFGSALNRSVLVWIQGVAAGLPIVHLVMPIVSARTIRRSGVAPWDRNGDLRVLQERHAAVGAIVAALLPISILAFGIWGWMME